MQETNTRRAVKPGEAARRIIVSTMIYCETHSMRDIKRKVGAFRELFQRPPDIVLAGTWEDDGGDAVFFDYRSRPATIKGSHVVAEVDGESAELNPTAYSGIYLS